jgi:PPM family protein phosphatase
MTPYSQTPAARLSAWFMRRTAPSAVRRVAPLNAAVASDVGVVREDNQDRVALVRGGDRNGAGFILAAVADGIGGMRQGAECASITLGTFIDAVVDEAQHSSEPRDWLWRGTARANRAVHAKHGGEGGSTLAAVLLAKGHRPLWVSVGDSRVYHASDANLRQLSRDDTLEGQLGKPIEGGRRSDLLQFVGIGESIEPHVEPVPWDVGGTMLLTTDGVHFIDPDFLAKVVHFSPDLGVCARRLTELAKMLGGPDNASVAALSLDALKADPETQLDSCFEVWDPFGELHVIVDRGLRRHASTAPGRSLAPERTPAAGPAVDDQATERDQKLVGQQDGKSPLKAGVRGASPKGKLSKNSKGSRKTRVKEAAADVRSEDGSDVPQLLIEFPHKPS